MHLVIPYMTGSKQPVVNLRELGIVREHHLPPHVVKFAPAEELERVVEEDCRLHPSLVEELHFVMEEELLRRARLAGSPLVAMKGGQFHA